jgi:hypothetical protein
MGLYEEGEKKKPSPWPRRFPFCCFGARVGAEAREKNVVLNTVATKCVRRNHATRPTAKLHRRYFFFFVVAFFLVVFLAAFFFAIEVITSFLLATMYESAKSASMVF